MEKNFGFWFDKNLSGFPFMSGCLNSEPGHRYPHGVDDSTLRNLPLTPVLSPASEEMLSMGRSDIGQQRSRPTGTAPCQKRFLVFDQSGGKTTLLYSSGVPSPAQFGLSPVPNPPTMRNLSKEDSRDDLRDITEDEMHEDTEELDALLYSDDHDSSEDDETSTGHSPSTMTDNGMPKQAEETGEEADSLSVAPKRQRLWDGLNDAPPNRYSASSLKTFACSELENDAESSHREELYPKPGCKRSRGDKIQETVNILQSIIPDANGKDPILVIDEAINYLRSLKAKAKALGLDDAI